MNGGQLVAFPIFVPLMGALLSLVSGPLAPGIVLLVSLITCGINVRILVSCWMQGPQAYWVGGWPPPYGIPLVADLFSSSMALVAALVAAAAAVYTVTTKGGLRGERGYHSFFLTMLAALGGVFYTGDLFNLYVFMELVILSSLPLVAMGDRPATPEITFKYAVLAAVGSGVLLAGVGMVYAAVGTLNLADIAQVVRRGPPVSWPLAAGALLFAFLLKAGIMPLQFWLPDAHSTAPTPVSAMLSGVLVKVGFYGIVRMQTLLFPDSPVFVLLVPLGGISAIAGGLAAIANPDLKRLLAYSTISNMGLILLALGWGGVAGMTAAVINAVNHAVIKSSLFLAGGAMTDSLHDHDLSRLGGMSAVMPGSAAAFGLGAAALAGLPPLNGFLSKFALFQAGLAAGDPGWLVVSGMASALGIAYALRAFVLLCWGETPSWIVHRLSTRGKGPLSSLAPWLLAGLCLLVGSWPGPVTTLASRIAAELSQPDQYIRAVLAEVP